VSEGGCKVNHIDTYGQTPLFYAAREGHVEVCRALVALNGDPDIDDAKGQTPLFYSVKQGRLEAAEYLISAGAEINHED